MRGREREREKNRKGEREWERERKRELEREGEGEGISNLNHGPFLIPVSRIPYLHGLLSKNWEIIEEDS